VVHARLYVKRLYEGGHLLRLLIATTMILSLVSPAPSQDLADDGVSREDNLNSTELNGRTYKEIERLIFAREQATVNLLSHSGDLITEGYVQSLGHSQHMAIDKDLNPGHEHVIDDKYFLAAVDLLHLDDRKRGERALFARSEISRYIRTDANNKEELFPLGQLAMFFVDLTSFDADTYKLTYESRERLGDTDCLRFSVAPIDPRGSGRFVGQIWIDSSSIRIVRIKGVFSGPFGFSLHKLWSAGRYFHFDSWREQVGDGLWLPTVAYFDERHTFPADGNLDFHYRGYTLLWQHQERANVKGTLAETLTAPEAAGVGKGWKSPLEDDVVVRLEKDGLLATPGSVEQSLNAIVHQITMASKIALNGIGCRVLLTTPAEIFSVGRVIILSRGLLNIVPDESVLAVLISRQIAHIILGQSDVPTRLFPKSIFELDGKGDFPGLGIRRTPNQEAAADEEALVLLNGSPYRDAVKITKVFLSQLNTGSNGFPNLLRPRFGTAVIPRGSSFATPQPTADSAIPENMVFLRNRYGVSWNGVVVRLETPDSAAEIGLERNGGQIRSFNPR
jgi:hypothetical protein